MQERLGTYNHKPPLIFTSLTISKWEKDATCKKKKEPKCGDDCNPDLWWDKDQCPKECECNWIGNGKKGKCQKKDDGKCGGECSPKYDTCSQKGKGCECKEKSWSYGGYGGYECQKK